MKYLEEISPGDSFRYENNFYILTIDFKRNGDKLCYSLNDGSPKWLESKTVIETDPIFSLDKDNNIIPIKITEKNNVVS